MTTIDKNQEETGVYQQKPLSCPVSVVTVDFHGQPCQGYAIDPDRGVEQKVNEQLKQQGHTIYPFPSHLYELLDIQPACPEITQEMVETQLGSADWAYLKDYQQEGVHETIRHGGRFFIFDDMGMGKTLQALMVIKYYFSQYQQQGKTFRALVLCPASMVNDWKQRIGKTLQYPHQYVEKTDEAFDTSVVIHIISMGQCSRKPFIDAHFRGRKRLKWDLMVIDESHKVQSTKSTLTKVLIALCKRTQYRLLLSGTAMSKNKHLYTQLKCLNHKWFPLFFPPKHLDWQRSKSDRFFFGQRFCQPRKEFIKGGDYTWNLEKSARHHELFALLRHLGMVRRLVSRDSHGDLQLPPKLVKRTVIFEKPVSELQKAMARVDLLRHEQSKLAGDAEFMALWRANLVDKIPYVLSYLETTYLPLTLTGEKVVLFGHHHAMLDALQQWLAQKKQKFIVIHGKIPTAKRGSRIQQFQEDPDTHWAVLGIESCGTGITLTAACYAVKTELIFVAKTHLQAEARIHRIGQNRPVTIDYAVVKNSTDDILYRILQTKYRNITSTLNGKRGFLQVSQEQAIQHIEEMEEET